MKLISVNAILIASVNISLFFKVYFVEGLPLPLTLFILSFIFIDLILLLEYEHRRFEKVEVDLHDTACLYKKYFYLFAAGIVLSLLQKFHIEQCHQYISQYVLLGDNVYYSLLYYSTNLLLGNTYLYLFRQNYIKANRERIPSEIARAVGPEETCTICLGRVREGQNVARIACMHVFHSQCLHKWSKKKSKCPICQSRIDVI